MQESLPIRCAPENQPESEYTETDTRSRTNTDFDHQTMQVSTNDRGPGEQTELTDYHDDCHGNELTVVLESTFAPSGEVACREYSIETESIPPGDEPNHWPVLTEDDTGRLLLDTDDFRAVWTGLGVWEGGNRR